MDSLYQDCTLLHVDADGFFAGVEQALNPSLRGKPVVTGAERGIIAAASYEAKALGVITAFDFTLMDEIKVLKLLHKPGCET